MMKTLVLNNDLDLCVISMFSNSFFFCGSGRYKMN